MVVIIKWHITNNLILSVNTLTSKCIFFFRWCLSLFTMKSWKHTLTRSLWPSLFPPITFPPSTKPSKNFWNSMECYFRYLSFRFLLSNWFEWELNYITHSSLSCKRAPLILVLWKKGWMKYTMMITVCSNTRTKVNKLVRKLACDKLAPYDSWLL